MIGHTGPIFDRPAAAWAIKRNQLPPKTGCRIGSCFTGAQKLAAHLRKRDRLTEIQLRTCAVGIIESQERMTGAKIGSFRFPAIANMKRQLALAGDAMRTANIRCKKYRTAITE